MKKKIIFFCPLSGQRGGGGAELRRHVLTEFILSIPFSFNILLVEYKYTNILSVKCSTRRYQDVKHPNL